MFCVPHIAVAGGWLSNVVSTESPDKSGIFLSLTQICVVSQPLLQGSAEAVIASTSVIAGRIAAAPNVLQAAIGTWLTSLRGRGKRGLDCYRQDIERGIREIPLADWSDLTHENLDTYLANKVTSGAWRGTTFNRNLSSWKSFTRYLARAMIIGKDPMKDTERAAFDGDQGSRAASIDEARAIILRAWMRQSGDERCTGDRALYWLCLFQHACRRQEPSKWRRKNLMLDHEVPHLRWTRDINKNRQEYNIALVPELATLLRAHLRRTDAVRADVQSQEDLIFPIVPSHVTFRADRKQADIAYEDEYGHRFTPHSARKYFSTTGTSSGIPEKFCDFFMRHAGRVEYRYFKPSLQDQVAQVAKMPRLWPESAGDGSVHKPRPLGQNGGYRKSDLTDVPMNDTLSSVTACPPTRTTRSREQARTISHAVTQMQNGDGPVRAVELVQAVVSGSSESSAKDQSRNAETEIHNGKATEIADLLDALARLLRRGASSEPPS